MDHRNERPEDSAAPQVPHDGPADVVDALESEILGVDDEDRHAPEEPEPAIEQDLDRDDMGDPGAATEPPD
ncbi:hypothetical protein GCM10011581_45780 [Saccharopolyspora subtropica]|uniref:Uncharacterized protein n=1 Tax=Saccharopolyspora thermophila TaxID=89367 RepID=A0A917KAX9_9PSEU|nr:hypothetical protein [Saccharopolyspora subtropica]GGJ03571.1 hypothetical protein GCM10011581_45780 [Saccharopolyspora subtropica]